MAEKIHLDFLLKKDLVKIPDQSLNPEEQLRRKQILEMLKEASERGRISQRELKILQLYHLEQMKPVEIARSENVHNSKIHEILKRANQKLREYFSKKGIQSPEDII